MFLILIYEIKTLVKFFNAFGTFYLLTKKKKTHVEKHIQIVHETVWN